MDLKDMGWGMDWIDLDQDRNRWWTVVKWAMNIRFYKNRSIS
jgi:hypothetical protein